MEQLVVRSEHRETRNAELACEGSRRREALTSTQPAFKDRVAEAYERMHSGRARFRVVLTMKPS